MRKTLSGDKIELRVIDEKDTDLICKWRNNKRVFNNFIFSETLTPEIHRKWLEEKVKTGLVEQFIIIEKKTNNPIGSSYFSNIDKEKSVAEYGVFIGEDDAVGKGYGNEVVEIMLSYAFNDIGLKEVFLRVFEDNDAAIKSYRNAGFRQRLEKEIIVKNGEEKTIIFMEIDKDEYRDREIKK